MAALVPIAFGAAWTLAAAWALGALLLRNVPAPRPVVLAAGGAALSLLVFLTLLGGVAGPVAFAAIGVAAIAGWAVVRPKSRHVSAPLPPVPLAVVFAAYGILYLVHALAPEVQPDGVAYHLGLVAEYLRRGSFPPRAGFYEMVPQGMEMLYLFAFAFGKHSAAKLVHLGFVFATVPLFVHTGRRLGATDAASFAAAALYVCAPVVGVTGTSSYTDAALAFYALCAFYLLLAWKQDGKHAYLFPAGLAAGFCYAVKFPGIVVLPVAAAAVLLLSRRLRPALVVGGAGMLMVAPWMLRNAVVTGNPLAPLFNNWFPNPYFHAAMELGLARSLGSYGGVTLKSAPWELAVGGKLQGILGPAWLALPLALLALRRRAGRLLWLAAAAVAVPWFWNMGTRFLLPAIPFLALAFALALPRPALWAMVAVQAVACWPAVLDLCTSQHTWRLRGFPVRAALRLEPEAVYLAKSADDYHVARLIEDSTAPGDRIFALLSAPRAYIDRETLEYWHSAEADELTDALKVAGEYFRDPFFDLRFTWPSQPLKGVRFRLTVPHRGEWCVHEAQLFLGEDRVHSSPQWTLRASPNPADVAAAFDDNLATRWRTWGPMRPGMFVEAVFDRTQVLSGAKLASHTPVYGVPVEMDGLGLDGKWRLLDARPVTALRGPEDLRRAAAHAVKRAGFGYILAPSDDYGNGPLGRRMAAEPGMWGMRVAAQVGHIVLFRIE